MSDYNTPSLTSTYSDFLDFLKARDVDSLTLQKSAVTNPPTGAIKLVRSPVKFQEYSSGSYSDILLDITGGGTGASSASGARTNLGLGSMATQSSSSVSITGGTIAADGAGITNLNASNIASGTVPTARLGSGSATSSTFLRGDSTWQIITFDLPYDTDKSSTFTAAVNTFYNLTGAGATVNLPTVVGNGGKIIGLIMKAAGSWIVDPNSTEQILGANTYTFNWGQFASLILKADANNNKWDII